MKSKRIFYILSLLSLFFIVGCNTVKGVGKDVERAGEEIQETTQDAKN